MLKITASNTYGQSLQVTQNSLFRVTAEGLNPPSGTVFTADLATKDGSIYNASKVNNRNIVLNIWPVGRNVEACRLELYKVFKVSKFIRLHIESGSRDCEIDGYIEDMTSDFDSMAQQLQISIICPDPFLTAKTATSAAVTTAGEPVTVANAGDFETGAVFEITATGACNGILIENSTRAESFGIDVDMAAGDKLTLNTKRGEKSLILTRAGEDPVNILNLMEQDSEWPLLQPGNNAILFDAAEGGANATMTVTFSALYGGI